MPDHWLRVLLRAELLERGYDAVGAPDVPTAFLYRPVERERAPVLAILIDQDALDEPGARLLALLLSRHERARALLLADALLEEPAGPWCRVVRKPVTLDRLASTIEEVSR
jgi:hypothetical protein